MSDHEIIVEQLLIKQVEAQNRTTHAIRAWMSLLLTILMSGTVAAVLFWFSIKATEDAKEIFFYAGVIVAAIGFLLGIYLANHEYSKSGVGLTDEVTDLI